MNIVAVSLEAVYIYIYTHTFCSLEIKQAYVHMLY